MLVIAIVNPDLVVENFGCVFQQALVFSVLEVGNEVCEC
jgi:hypothetical protein